MPLKQPSPKLLLLTSLSSFLPLETKIRNKVFFLVFFICWRSRKENCFCKFVVELLLMYNQEEEGEEIVDLRYLKRAK